MIIFPSYIVYEKLTKYNLTEFEKEEDETFSIKQLN